MRVGLLFVSFNRRAFAEATFETLLANTNWDRIDRLHVLDDHSTDGTADLLRELTRTAPTQAWFADQPFGGPVAAMNLALDRTTADILVKIDSDFVVCAGWLDALLAVLEEEPIVDVLGMEAGFGARGLAPVHAPRSFLPARWVGGIGAFRTRIFAKRRPNPSGEAGRFGWTAFQRQHRGVKGWLDPDLPCFALDRIPVEPWATLSAEYVERGWQRHWDAYSSDMGPYFDWWLEQAAAA